MTLNTKVTNNRNFGQGSDVTDAQLYVFQTVCCQPPNPGVPAYGRLISDTTLEWHPLVVIPPGTSGSAMLQISNIRAKGFGVSAVQPNPGMITASVSLTGPWPAPIVPVPNTLTIAFVLSGLGVSLQPSTGAVNVRLQEMFPTAFKPLGYPLSAPGYIVIQEDGLLTPGSGVNNGGATQGTRFILRFADVPGGVHLLVPHMVQTSGGLDIRRVFNADSSGAGGCYYLGCMTPPPGGTMGEVDLSKTGGFAVYEVVNSFPYGIDQADISLVACRGKVDESGCHTILSPPALRDMTVRTSFAPVSTIDTSTPGAPAPRFVEVGIPLIAGK
ncbi:MAG TPA: hypothetical protein VFA33_04705 [Bryobacteraceae bacterium]|nr:hypothetical protein [Bryobacteraceae bacterium]